MARPYPTDHRGVSHGENARPSAAQVRRAIQHLQTALANPSAEEASQPAFRAVHYDRLSDLHFTMYQMTGSRTEYEAANRASARAVRTGRSATETPPPGYSTAAQWWALQASRHNTRYERFDDYRDLDGAIESYEEAIALLPLDSSLRGVLLMNQANCLCTRYEAEGGRHDIEEAIHRATASLQLGGSNAVTVMNDLSTMYLSRFQADPDRPSADGDVQAATRLGRCCVEATSSDDPRLPTRLLNLANGLLAYHEHGVDDEIALLDEAILALERAETLCQSELRLHVLSKLAHAFHSRYLRARTLSDLLTAIRKASEALSLTREQSHHADVHVVHSSLMRLLQSCAQEARNSGALHEEDIQVEA